MQLVVRGKNLEVSDSLRQLVEGKLGKVDRYFEDITEAVVELSYDKNLRNAEARTHVDVSLLANGALLLRAEAQGRDLRTALDSVADVIQRRTVRHKEKLQQRGRVSAAKTVAAIAAGLDAADAIASVPLEDDEDEEESVRIEQREILAKPLTVDEALESMYDSDDVVLAFINATTDQINVLHRRDDGHYILYVPPRG
jgi:putative sigma-54 modulation protein